MNRFIILLTVILHLSARGQNSATVATRNLAWGTVQTDYEFNQHFSASLDLQLRYEYTDGDMFQWLARTGVTYKTNSGWQFTLGFGRHSLYPNPNGIPPRPEWRYWQEISRKWKLGVHHTVYPKLRLEQRFIKGYENDILDDHFVHNSDRVRLRGDYKYSFGKDGSGHLYLFAGDEVIFQRFDNGFSNFDQNRAWGGLGYKINQAVAVQASYLNIYQQRNSSTFDQFHVLRLGVQLTLKRKVEEETK